MPSTGEPRTDDPVEREVDHQQSDRALASGAAYFATVAEQLHAEPAEQVTLERITARVFDVIPATRYCGITMRRRRGRLETAAASDPLVNQCDQLQYELDDGPCVDAATDHGYFLVHDTATDPRWPTWGPRAAELGIRSLIAVQLSAPRQDDPDAVLGAINIYHDEVGGFSADDLDRAIVYASHSASALSSARVISGLQTAVHSRHLIGVAQGILMQRYSLTLDRAFEALRRYSNESNIKLNVLAQMVVENRAMPNNNPPEGDGRAQ